jgi:hypothetical protein
VVVAVCAIFVTVKVVGSEPQRLLDQEAVERQASATVRSGKMSRDGVFCPAAIEARKGNTFECDVYVAPGESQSVEAEVVDDQGKIRMSS